ncbi:MAG: hypothetical protein R3E84_16375 [Pseudomonadales bacterium]
MDLLAFFNWLDTSFGQDVEGLWRYFRHGANGAPSGAGAPGGSVLAANLRVMGVLLRDIPMDRVLPEPGACLISPWD